jgi:hypothetical protein
MIVLRSPYVQKVVGDATCRHSPHESGQDVKADVRGNLARDRIEQRGTSNHDSSERQRAGRHLRLLGELTHDVFFIHAHDAATPWIRNVADAQCCHWRATLVKLEYVPQIGSREDIGIKNPKYRVRAEPRAIREKRASTSEQNRLFGNAYFNAVTVFLEEFSNHVSVRVDIDEDFVDLVPPAEI